MQDAFIERMFAPSPFLEWLEKKEVKAERWAEMASFEAKEPVDRMIEVIRSNGTNFANFIDQSFAKLREQLSISLTESDDRLIEIEKLQAEHGQRLREIRNNAVVGKCTRIMFLCDEVLGEGTDGNDRRSDGEDAR